MKNSSIATFLLLLVAGLAGCASPEPTDPAALSSSMSATNVATGAPGLPGSTSTIEVDLAFVGNLGGDIYACVPVHCHGQELGPGADNNLVTPPPGRVRSATMTVTWTAQTPATERLYVGFMIMDQCGGCNVTMLATANGASPLTVTATDLDLPVTDANWIHAFVRNTTGDQSTAAGSTHATPDQAFTMAGTVVIETPAPTPG